MWTAVIALVLLAQGGETQLMRAKAPTATEEACTELLAKALTGIHQLADERYGPDGYMLAGRCLQGQGQPADARP